MGRIALWLQGRQPHAAAALTTAIAAYVVYRRMLCVGLTGGIAAGKTTVSNAWAAAGAVIVDADVVARDVLAPGTRACHAVSAAFPACVDAATGAIDRRALRSIVMADAAARRRLNGIVHPAILRSLAYQ